MYYFNFITVVTRETTRCPVLCVHGFIYSPYPTFAHFLSKRTVLQGHDDMEIFSDWKKKNKQILL